MGKVQKKQEQELRAIKGKAKTAEKSVKKAEVAKIKREAGKRQPAQQIIVPSSDERPEPPYNYEIHVKNAQCIVNVTLHKVPGSCIDISKTNRRHLIVDCGKYTKKFYLDFELPHNMTIDPEKAEYTFESGILKCVLPSDTGAVTESARKEREDFINKVKDQKHLRFRTTKEGELVVRNKLSMLKLKEEKKQKRDEKRQEQSKKAIVDEATPVGSSKYVSDDAMAAMAATIGSKTKSELTSKVKALKAKETGIEKKLAERNTKKEARKEKQTGAFKRVVEEQKRKLAERLALSQPKPKDTSGKKVTFQ